MKKDKTGLFIFGFVFLVLAMMLSLLFYSLTKEVLFSVGAGIFMVGILSFFLLNEYKK